MGIESADPAGYSALVALAAADPERYWDAVIRHMGLQFYQPYSQVLDTGKGIEFAAWCVGGTTNVVLNCLDRHDFLDDPTRLAIVWEGEDGTGRSWSYGDLNRETCRIAAGLRSLGIGRGDVVGVMLPMVPEAVAAMLAIPKIGAIVLPLFSGFGAGALEDRLIDGGAVAIITADGSWRRGKPVDIKRVVDSAAANVPSLRHTVVLRNTGTAVEWDEGRDRWWHDLLSSGKDSSTEEMPAEAPMMLMYTSGTSGKPKGTVHSHCGFSTKLALDMGLCFDIREGDRILWMSDMGWLAGPMLVYGGMLLGATLVLAEGAPDYPGKDRFWRLIDENQVTILGIAPTIVRSFMAAGGGGVDGFDLSSLRVTFSTGEAWTAPAWTWMFENVCRRRVPILNYSGGTEIGGGLVTGTVLHPMKPTAFAGEVPGSGIDLVDDAGRSIEGAGIGELVLRRPSIGLTRSLWNDPQRYLESYWEKIPGVWAQGDRAERDGDGFLYIHGRSDDTLKIAGKRVGPAEIETLAAATGRIAEVAAIGVPDEVKGQAVVLVVTPLPGETDPDDLRGILLDAVVAGLGGAFKPSRVLIVDDLPKTRNMKVMRRLIRAACLGEPVGDTSSLVNPEALDAVTQAAAAN